MKLVYLGKLTKPHGLCGSIFFQMENPLDSQIGKGTELLLGNEDNGTWYKVESLNVKGKRPMIKFQEFNSINDIEDILPMSVYMKRSDFNKPEPGEFYLFDIKDFQVVDIKTSENLGVIEEFYDNGGGQSIMVIKGEGSEWDYPVDLVEKENINWEENKVKIFKPEYL